MSKEQIEKELECEFFFKGKVNNLPGGHKKHYSPLKEMIIADNINKEVLFHYPKRIGLLQFSDELIFEDVSFKLSFLGDLTYASKHLFSFLHFLDSQDIDFIICERFPNEGLGLALNDRIERASVS